MTSGYDIDRIARILPHRYPFLLIDRVLESIPGERLRAVKNVTINEPFFAGHFPENPVMPGVLIIEAMAQAGALALSEALPPEKKTYFYGIDKARFRKHVVPGDQLILDVELVRKRSRAVMMFATTEVDGQRVAQAELMALIRGE